MTVFPEDDEPEVTCVLCGRPTSIIGGWNICSACVPTPSSPAAEPWGLDPDGE